MRPPRFPLFGFPDVVLHADESAVKRHPQYQAGKTGDLRAADVLITALASREAVQQVSTLLAGRSAELVPIHALESRGVNEIPASLANEISRLLGLKVSRNIVQLNSVGHTGAGGFERLANQALFFGSIVPGQRYFIVDDFVGQGGTLANLIGFIRSQGGEVLGATVLTGKPYSAKLAPDETQIQALRAKHGPDLEEWWRKNFGFGFDHLTRSEARYLENTPNADTIRGRLAAAGLAAGAESPGTG